MTFLNLLGKTFPGAVLTLAALVPVAAYLWQGTEWVVKSLFLSVPLFLVWLLATKLPDHPKFVNAILSCPASRKRPPLVLGSLFLVAQGASFILLAIAPERPLAYFGIVAGTAGLLFLQAIRLESKGAAYPVLAGLWMLSFNINWGIALNPAFYFGGTDVMGHLPTITSLASGLGHPQGYAPEYAGFAIFHVMSAQASIVTGLNVAVATFLTHWFTTSMLMLFAYVFAKRIAQSARAGLLAALVVTCSPVALNANSYPVPRTLALVFFTVLMLVWSMWESRGTWPRSMLSLLLATALVLTHHVTLPVLLALALAFFFALKLSRGGAPQRHGPYLADLAILFVVGLAHWLFGTEGVLAPYIADWVTSFHLSSALAPTLTGIGRPAAAYDEYLWSTAYLWFIVFFTFWGILCVLRAHTAGGAAGAGRTATALLALVAIFLYIPSPLSKVVSHSLLLYRMPLFTLPFVAIATGSGWSIFLDAVRETRGRRVPALLVSVIGAAVVAAVSFTCITSASVCPDVALFGAPRDRTSFAQSELSAMTFISTHNPQERTVLSDYYVYRAVYHLGHATPRAPIQGTDITRAEDEFVILRVDELQRFGLYCQRPDGPDSLYLLRPSARAVAELEQSIASANLVSSSGSTLVLVNS